MSAETAHGKTPTPVRWARLVSLVFHPFLVSPSAIVLLLWLDRRDLRAALAWAALCTGMVVLPALVHLRRKLRRREYSDADVSRREQRLGFYLFGCACMVLCYAVLHWLHAPAVLLCGFHAALLATGLAILANRFWTKISIHAGTMAGLTALLAHYSLPLALLLGAGTLLVAWARLVLKQHTLTQAVAGAVIAAVSVVALF